jgi:sulfate/thiosulfate-binding protein
MKISNLIIALFGIIFFASASSVNAAGNELLNVSYDPTREFYDEYNKKFIEHWKKTSGKDVRITQSHGGSGKQARSVLDGLKADVVTLALSYDIDVLAEKGGLLPNNWQAKLLNNSSPYTSTIVLVVRKGNPKSIKDWGDLIRQDVQVVTPNPKTSGGARWNYLALWAYADKKFAKDELKTKEFIGQVFKNVPVLDAGARGATTTFLQRGIGDVLVSWENEAHLAVKESKGNLEIIYPSISILAEPPVAVVEKNAARNGTLEVATEYLNYLYSADAQQLVVKHYYRPSDAKLAAQYTTQFPKIKMVTIADFGGWKDAQKKHFDDNGTFDQIYIK